MLKLVRYLKPFVFMIILIFGLLYMQAMTDLSLPDFMSDIVNVGIQQKGIDEATPIVLRSTELDKLKLLMTDEEQALVNESFELNSSAALPVEDYAKLVKKYPLLATESLSICKNVDQDTKARLNTLFARTITAAEAISNGTGMTGLPEGQDPFDVLATLPAGQRTQILSAIQEKISQQTDTTLLQVATLWLGQEYDAIGIDQSAQQTRYILTSGGLMLLVALLGMLCAVSVGFLSARVAVGVSRNLRQMVFSKVESFSNAEFDHFSTASLITRSTNDIQQIQMSLVMLLRILFYAPIMGVGGVIKIMNSNTSMTWIIAVAVGFLLMLIIVLFAIAMPRFKAVQKLVDRLNLVTREILSGLMVIRAFNTQASQEKKFDRANRDLRDTTLFINRMMSLMMPVMMLIMNGVTLLIVWNGAHQIEQGQMQVGDMMAFMTYSMQIIMSFLMVSFVFILLPRASVSAQRISEVLEIEVAIKDPGQPVALQQPVNGLITFDHVNFRYPEAESDVLCDISFTAQPGQTTAFIGSTGSGKSTLINLIPRFYDVTDGAILLDGQDIRRLSQHDLREQIGYVPQKGILFTGSIQSNIAYGRLDATDEEIRHAAGIAQVMDFIEQSTDGLDAEIAQGGNNVSGGQKQRLSIARALTKKPQIFIFDDSFSALDYKTDAALRKALHEDTAQATVLIVAQRIGTIRNADQIIVLDEGQIVGKGTHKQLMENCPVYAEIAFSQLSKEELDA